MDVVFRPQAEEDLTELYRYIATESSDADIAYAFTLKLRDACLSLSTFPERGPLREDVQKGLRILSIERRSIIAYRVTSRVEILGIFHGGQDWHAALSK
jgi:toxin ParE1/3/4